MTETTEITAEDFRGILGEKLKKYPEAIPFVVELVCCHGCRLLPSLGLLR